MRSLQWKAEASHADRDAKVRCVNGHWVADLPANYSPKVGQRTRRWTCRKCGVAVNLPFEAINARL